VLVQVIELMILSIIFCAKVEAQISGPSRIMTNESATFYYTGYVPEDIDEVYWDVFGNGNWGAGVTFITDPCGIVDSLTIQCVEGEYYMYVGFWANEGNDFYYYEKEFSVVTPTTEFSYDNAGNRISRTLVYYCEGDKKSAKSRGDILRELEKTTESVVYPNPTDGLIFLKSEERAFKSDSRMYYLFDLSGKMVSNGKVNNPVEEISLDGFENGMYVLVLKWGNQKKEWKIIKQ
jgi:hypothetical protein